MLWSLTIPFLTCQLVLTDQRKLEVVVALALWKDDLCGTI